MRKRTKARELALKALYQIELSKEPAEEALDRLWRMENNIEPSIVGFTKELVAGVVKNREAIDKAISTYAENWELSRMAVIDRNIMRISCYEMLYRGDIPPKVSINEAVDMAKMYGAVDSGKFVNGILDKICKQERKDGTAG